MLAGALTCAATPLDGDGAARVGIQSQISRYRALSTPLTVFTLEASGEVRAAEDVSVFFLVPSALALVPHTACCLLDLGNVTGGLRAWPLELAGVKLGLEAGVSLPSSSVRGKAAHASRLAATTKIATDAGVHVPGATTWRMGALLHVQAGPMTAEGSLGVQQWDFAEERESEDRALIVASLTTSVSLTRAFFAMAGVASALDVRAIDEHGALAVDIGVGCRGVRNELRLQVHKPIDETSRDLHLIGARIAVLWSF
jgi:hypothetical protein